jgi:hypothetical protein
MSPPPDIDALSTAELKGWLCHGNLNQLAEARQEGFGSCRCGRSPSVKCAAPEDAQRVTGCEVTLGVEGVVDGGMNRQEALS